MNPYQDTCANSDIRYDLFNIGVPDMSWINEALEAMSEADRNETRTYQSLDGASEPSPEGNPTPINTPNEDTTFQGYWQGIDPSLAYNKTSIDSLNENTTPQSYGDGIDPSCESNLGPVDVLNRGITSQGYGHTISPVPTHEPATASFPNEDTVQQDYGHAFDSYLTSNPESEVPVRRINLPNRCLPVPNQNQRQGHNKFPLFNIHGPGYWWR
ncbi:uncharacterized protein CIMG_10937 [Coccidioides immitis RS]|uniref:Uncharacterized protein n=3 Tax=Coccidioides immitis TaxID=5501 RepID=A0A0D8JSR4_COCIM|nr:uncharacterized protein CIMG_10937 [Coccidioides immitis RS]KJF60021.1 hypothetical protein CIMG_10937 [Coccidioides immitis RS]KMP09968.1 hypothetical protein CIRG_09201 [Coccidioides immitis RMSCC 2394]KMU86483.1 hypothetical protein CIHG_04272 [Coccidioides immitis H538.4]